MGLLTGVRVLDLSTVLAGPYVTMLLGDMGADVIKLERPPKGDEMRYMPPFFYKHESAYFIAVNRNKKSIVIDLKQKAGVEIFYELVRQSDVVFNNARPGVMDRLGLSYEELKKVNERLVYCALSGYGRDSPYGDRPSYDLVIQALSGVMSLTGEAGRPPVRLGVSMGDLAGGMYSVIAIVLALFHRERTGRGIDVDVALLDSLVSLVTYLSQYYWIGNYVPGPIGSGHVTSVPYQAFRSRDSYMVIDAHSDKHWRLLCEVLEVPEMADDERFSTLDARRRNKDELVEKMEAILSTRTTAEWLNLGNRMGVPMAPINTLDQALSDESILHRGMVRSMEHALGGTIKVLANPIHISGEESADLTSPPTLGQHTLEVLRDAGYPSDALRSLLDQGVIYQDRRFAPSSD